MIDRAASAHGEDSDDLVRGLLHQLLEQYVAMTRIDGPVPQLITVDGWVVGAARLHVGSHSVERFDARVTGHRVTGVHIGPAGHLALSLTDENDTPVTPISAPAPWSITGPRGAGLSATRDGSLGIHPPAGPRYATPESMERWASSTPSDVEYELLWSAEDDWLTPADVIRELHRSGEPDAPELDRLGIDVLSRLVARGDVVEGRIRDGDFEPTDRPLDEVIEHIGTTWNAIGRDHLLPGHIGWFDLTAAGLQRLQNAPPPHPGPADE